MTYTPQGPFSTGGTATAANLTAMDAGIATNDTAVNGSQTPSESATPAASGNVATLLSFIATQIKRITGGTHWYSAPATPLTGKLNNDSGAISTNGSGAMDLGGVLTLHAGLSIPGGVATLDNGAILTDGTGKLTALMFLGPIQIDQEGGQTVIRSYNTTANVIIQSNGHNWTFRNDGKLVTPSGAIIS